MTSDPDFQSLETFQKEEIERLRDLLPASFRAWIKVVPHSGGERLLVSRRQAPWQPQGTIAIDFRRWQGIPQPHRDLLFLREVGWLSHRNWLQPGFYQLLALFGGITTLVELSLQHPFSALLAGGITALSVRQIWQSLNRESAPFDADEFALRRAQFRGYTRQEAAQHLAEALEQTLKLDPSDILTALRLQRLRTIARNLTPSPGSS
ncbi:DUF3318 domain-containing protein [Synechococcus sp. W70.1]|uniref:DUF3318 domain-containing protein n=1 Tax=Synechococcus sp. W70.1 TaxID=2964534 RepID=UPI0039C4CA8B